jgi:hypothetical protein
MVLEISEKDSMFNVKWQVNSQGFSTDWIQIHQTGNQFWCSSDCFEMIKENVYLPFGNYHCSSAVTVVRLQASTWKPFVTVAVIFWTF